MKKSISFITLIIATVVSFHLSANSMLSLSNSSDTDKKTDDPMKITSNSMDVDFKNDIITLIDNVKVEDTNTTITSDKMLIYLQDKKKNDKNKDSSDKTGKEAKTIIALGDVVVIQRNISKNESKNGERKSTCGRADYDTNSGIIILTENPVIYQQDSYVKGNRIILWKDSDRMKVESGGPNNNSSIAVINQDKN